MSPFFTSVAKTAGLALSLSLTGLPLASFAAVPAPAPRAGDYRTRASGTFADAAVWETYNGSTYQPALTAPSAVNGTITISSGHTVAITTSLMLDEVFIQAGGVLSHSGLAELTILNSPEVYDFIVQGTYRELSATSQLMPVPGAFVLVDDNGTFEHSANGGALPVAFWSTTSTLLFDGITSATSLSGRLGQEFGRVVWNCPLQNSTFAFGPTATESNAVTTVAAGDFRVVSTGTGILQLSSDSKISPLYFSANFEQLGGQVYVNHGTTSARTLNVLGNFTQRGGTFTVLGASSANATGLLQISGALRLLGGTLVITSSPRAGSVSVTGDVQLAAGATLHTTGAGTATFNFAPGPVSRFINQGTISGPILFNVNGGTTLDFDEQFITGSGTFTLSDGSIGMFASPDGISAVGASDQNLGCVRVGNVSQFQRTYSPLAYFLYTGRQAQVTGSGLPAEIGTASATLNAGGFGVYNSSPAGTVTLSQPLRISGELILSRGYVVSAPGRKLTLSASALMDPLTKGSTDAFVQGVLARDMVEPGKLYEYPIGDTRTFRPVAMRITSVTSPVTYDATAHRGTAPNSTALAVGPTGLRHLDGDAYWEVVRTEGVQNAVLRVPYDPALVADENIVTVAGYNPVTNQWEDMGVVSRNQADNWVEAQLRPQMRLYALGTAGSLGPLPVQLISFTAMARGAGVELAWRTASERNSEYFAVERSADGRDFKEIDRVAAAGNTLEPRAYTVRDQAPLTGRGYYRLRQVDTDGTTAFSPIVTATVNAAEATAQVTMFPNPAIDQVTVRLSETSASAAVRIVNALGQDVLRQELASTVATLDLAGLPDGAYLVTLTAADQPAVTQRLLKASR